MYFDKIVQFIALITEKLVAFEEYKTLLLDPSAGMSTILPLVAMLSIETGGQSMTTYEVLAKTGGGGEGLLCSMIPLP